MYVISVHFYLPEKTVLDRACTDSFNASSMLIDVFVDAADDAFDLGRVVLVGEGSVEAETLLLSGFGGFGGGLGGFGGGADISL